jgi:hypothetical protein
MLYGKRFDTGKEANHRNETDDTIWQTAQDKHLFLAERYNWSKVVANQSQEKVLQDIIKVLEEKGVISVQ